MVHVHSRPDRPWELHMSEASKAAREAAKKKIERLVRADPKAKVDASGYTPPDALNADVKTGARPVSDRLYGGYPEGGRKARRRGGKILGVYGKDAAQNAGRKPRQSGGGVTDPSFDVREDNEKRDGIKHVGAFKKGGKVHDDAAEDKKLIEKEVKPSALRKGRDMGGGLIGLAAHNGVSEKNPTGGLAGLLKKDGGSVKRKARYEGGATSDMGDMNAHGIDHAGKIPYPIISKPNTPAHTPRKNGGKAMNVNIIIGKEKPPSDTPAPGLAGGPPPGMPPMPPPMPPKPPMGMPPVMGPGGPPPPTMGPPGPPPLPGRKRGGAVKHGLDHWHTAAGGLGRLEKRDAYGHQDR